MIFLAVVAVALLACTAQAQQQKVLLPQPAVVATQRPVLLVSPSVQPPVQPKLALLPSTKNPQYISPAPKQLPQQPGPQQVPRTISPAPQQLPQQPGFKQLPQQPAPQLKLPQQPTPPPSQPPKLQQQELGIAPRTNEVVSNVGGGSYSFVQQIRLKVDDASNNTGLVRFGNLDMVCRKPIPSEKQILQFNWKTPPKYDVTYFSEICKQETQIIISVELTDIRIKTEQSTTTTLAPEHIRHGNLDAQINAGNLGKNVFADLEDF